MKAFLIDPETKTVTEQDYDGQPNSLFTLFRSLLVDSSELLNSHMVYSSEEAFEKGEKGFFLGEKLLIGKVLVTGRSGLEDTDAVIGRDELYALTLFELPAFYQEVLRLLPKDFSFSERYGLMFGEESGLVSPEWVFYVFNMADDATKSYFLEHLENTDKKAEAVHGFLKKMGSLALKSARQ